MTTMAAEVTNQQGSSNNVGDEAVTNPDDASGSTSINEEAAPASSPDVTSDSESSSEASTLTTTSPAEPTESTLAANSSNSSNSANSASSDDSVNSGKDKEDESKDKDKEKDKDETKDENETKSGNYVINTDFVKEYYDNPLNAPHYIEYYMAKHLKEPRKLLQLAGRGAKIASRVFIDEFKLYPFGFPAWFIAHIIGSEMMARGSFLLGNIMDMIMKYTNLLLSKNANFNENLPEASRLLWQQMRDVIPNMMATVAATGVGGSVLKRLGLFHKFRLGAGVGAGAGVGVGGHAMAVSKGGRILNRVLRYTALSLLFMLVELVINKLSYDFIYHAGYKSRLRRQFMYAKSTAHVDMATKLKLKKEFESDNVDEGRTFSSPFNTVMSVTNIIRTLSQFVFQFRRLWQLNRNLAFIALAIAAVQQLSSRDYKMWRTFETNDKWLHLFRRSDMMQGLMNRHSNDSGSREFLQIHNLQEYAHESYCNAKEEEHKMDLIAYNHEQMGRWFKSLVNLTVMWGMNMVSIPFVLAEQITLGDSTVASRLMSGANHLISSFWADVSYLASSAHRSYVLHKCTTVKPVISDPTEPMPLSLIPISAKSDDEACDVEELDFTGITIEFRNVCFSYPTSTSSSSSSSSKSSTEILKNLNLIIPAGQSVALVGQNGAGKSTIAKLLCRSFDVTSGAILLNGVDIRNINLKDLRESIAYFPQSSPMFYESVHNMIAMGRLQVKDWKEPVESDSDIADVDKDNSKDKNKDGKNEPADKDTSDDKDGTVDKKSIKPKAKTLSRFVIEEAAKHGCAHDVIMKKMPEGYDTELYDWSVGKPYVNPSGGERQRMCASRLFLRIGQIDIPSPSSQTDQEQEQQQQQQQQQRELPKAYIILVDEPNNSLDAESHVAIVDNVYKAGRAPIKHTLAAAAATAAASTTGNITTGNTTTGKITTGRRTTGKRTTIIISHDMATARKADRIIALDKGAIVEDGSHDELMRSTADKPIYKTFFELQASGFKSPAE